MRVSFTSVARLLILLYVAVFILYPLAYLVLFVVSPRSLSEVVAFLESDLFLSSLKNSLYVALVTTLLATLIGVPYAYALHRYKVLGKNYVLSATFMPTMVPPFVGALSVIFLLGRFGTVNLLLMEWGLIERPINFIYGLHGVILVQTITLFPWIAINVYNSLLKLDRSLEEAAESLGAPPIRRFFTVTLPAVTPGLMTGLFMVFSFAFTDYATPIVLGQYELLAPQAFVNIQQAIDESRVRTGTYMVFFMLVIVIGLFLAMKKYISLREYASLRLPRPVEEVELRGVRRVLVPLLIYLALFVGLLPHVFVFVISLSKAWSLTPLPTSYSLENFATIFHSPTPFVNTAIYAAIGTAICLLVGMFGAYVVTRTNHPLNEVIDSALSMMFVVPGIVVGTSFLFAFRKDIPVMGVLGSTWLIMPLMLATRRITYTIRYAYATYVTIRRSLEEAAYVFGEKPLGTFFKIVMPNAIYGILAGTLFSFIEIVNELTASLFLYKPGWETVTIQMFIQITAGQFPVSAAYAVVLFVVSIALATVAMTLASKKR
ncbi:ABC transporter permease [Thermofilum pendens]|uniref:Binding-protein-dependent transport systems inner membrane component n=1 Tax=Thermofilum pendens (strain DSM 2475 / Hrk 5) TaxID=368408 RepID=A1S0A4_THEPD|nr:iron ABC transporter permease [Thermofilum pendens]ABL78884.1 binding-protein-dependent transport systems inner membrane component [Thermofilum pendens Hrk 5]